MNLKLQIQTLISCFLFGMIFSFTYNIMYKYLYINNKILRVINNFIYILINSILYFYILYLINCGVVHPYFLLITLIGFITGNHKTKKVRTKVNPNKKNSK